MKRPKRFSHLLRPLQRAIARVCLCSWGRHHASRGRARFVAEDWHSVCRDCGVPMRRTTRQWVVTANEE